MCSGEVDVPVEQRDEVVVRRGSPAVITVILGESASEVVWCDENGSGRGPEIIGVPRGA